jgi:hypothetical protein
MHWLLSGGEDFIRLERKKNIIFSMFAVAAPLGCSTAGAIGSAFAQDAW